ncbi:MAG: HAMP domain-containing histidine kinase [Lachnospiraceae bacterium]|nr:HAMP domain-containing histidine kinase [Lachnospiraceae bacterium]
MGKKHKTDKKVTSITRKLYVRSLLSRISSLVIMDILLFILAFFGWIYMQESIRINSFSWNRDRSFINKTKHIYYIVKDKHEELINVDATQFIHGLILFIVVVIIVQFIIGLTIYSANERRRIRKILSPINEMALKADEINMLTSINSIDKYTELENAIDKISLESTRPLSCGESDLAGIEAAVNNLIIRMRESYKQQTRFVDDASHELRTPIAVIKGYTDMLKRWGSSDPKVLEEGIEAISQEIEHMNTLVEQLLFLARGDSGRTELNVSEISLFQLMNEIYEESLMIDESHIYKILPCDEDITVNVDTALFKQAVRILIDNAAKYTPDKEEIRLSVGRIDSDKVYVEVQDSGIGMVSEDVNHMFDRFFRSDDVRSFEGSGLGLSIAKWIVDKHKGYFEILSREGLGTRIRIILNK